jgi:hypothetical protein
MEHREQLLSVERAKDMEFVAEVAEVNRQEIHEHKRMNEENKKICREFWQEQLVLHKKHRQLMDYL